MYVPSIGEPPQGLPSPEQGVCLGTGVLSSVPLTAWEILANSGPPDLRRCSLHTPCSDYATADCWSHGRCKSSKLCRGWWACSSVLRALSSNNRNTDNQQLWEHLENTLSVWGRQIHTPIPPLAHQYPVIWYKHTAVLSQRQPEVLSLKQQMADFQNCNLWTSCWHYNWKHYCREVNHDPLIILSSLFLVDQMSFGINLWMYQN